MADAKPLKLVDQGGGVGRLAEFEAGDTLPKAALPALSAADVGGVAADDSRLSDAREWIAGTVSQTEAEAGTATTRRAWTAQRVRQAIVAWWNSVSSAWGRGFVASADAAAGRTALELGNAATANLGTTGDAIGKLNTSNTWSGIQTLTAANTRLLSSTAGIWLANDLETLGLYVVLNGGSLQFQRRAANFGGPPPSGPFSPFRITMNEGFVEFGNVLRPAADNSHSLGSADRRPTQLFAVTATIGTSDAREKTQVRKLTDAELDAAIALADELGAYRWLSAMVEKGDWARDHIGMTVQRAIEVMEAHGLEPFNYGFICYDQWPDEIVEHPAQYEQVDVPAVLDDDGNEREPARVEQGDLISEARTELVRPAGDRYSFRGEELQAFILAGLAARQRSIEDRLAGLEIR